MIIQNHLNSEERVMTQAASSNWGTNQYSPLSSKSLTSEDKAHLREILKRCSASTYQVACQFRITGHIEHLPAIVLGVIERYVEPDLRSKLKHPQDELCLIEDLGIDSLTMMEIVILVEDVLQISINTEELCQLRTLGNVRHFIECKLGAPPLQEQHAG
jgi:acyl carrier protein